MLLVVHCILVKSKASLARISPHPFVIGIRRMRAGEEDIQGVSVVELRQASILSKWSTSWQSSHRTPSTPDSSHYPHGAASN
jgi:hypothetical protein